MACPATTDPVDNVTKIPPPGARPYGSGFICPCASDDTGAYTVPYNTGDSAVFAFVSRPASLPSTLDFVINSQVLSAVSTTSPYVQPANVSGLWTIQIDTTVGGVHYLSDPLTVKVQ
jgi:hypothetical protein